MNIAEILKNYPIGTKLYSPIFGDVTFNGITEVIATIKVLKDTTEYEFFQDGRYYNAPNAECMLFPSKDNRKWNRMPTFPKGSYLTINFSGNLFTGILNYRGNNTTKFYAGIWIDVGKIINNRTFDNQQIIVRQATIEESAKLTKALLRINLVWNSIKLEFDEYFKPFDKVLVRNYDTEIWKPAYFSEMYIDEDVFYDTIGSGFYKQCIHYEENKHLANKLR